METTREAIRGIHSYVEDSLVRVLDMPRDMWTPTLDSIRGMREILDILEGLGKEGS